MIFAGQELSYKQLDDRASRLGQYLQSMGVGEETLVGVFMNRSLGMMVALLATLKAGGAYVPLDPAYPSERTALVIKDSGAPVVLTTDHLRDRLPAVDARVLSLDSEAAAIAPRTADPVLCPATGSNLAYVIYTSGSTGKPKGVMVEVSQDAVHAARVLTGDAVVHDQRPVLRPPNVPARPSMAGTAPGWASTS